MAHLIVGSTSYHTIQVFGNKKGQPFDTEKGAKHRMSRMAKRYPHLDFFTIEISATNEAGYPVEVEVNPHG